MATIPILKESTKEMCPLAFAQISNSFYSKPLSHTAQPDYIPPEADALAFPHVGSAATSSWLGFGSLSSTCELRNHFRSDPVQVQSTMLPCIMSGYPPESACVAIVGCPCISGGEEERTQNGEGGTGKGVQKQYKGEGGCGARAGEGARYSLH